MKTIAEPAALDHPYDVRLKNTIHTNSERTRRRYTLGVCAMDKKAQSQPMREILSRLPATEFKTVIFGDHCILNTDVQDWPICDALIAFFSTGFPLDKVLEYVKLREPLLVNDLEKQRVLMDRRDVYQTLTDNNLPVPRHVFVNRDGYGEKTELIEEEDYIEVKGVRIHKPFVEKPVDGENHNVYIYYPMNAGGGSKRLFRKIGDKSSDYFRNENKVRREGSFIYEEFLSTQGTDVKVYTVGPNYAHAEARKSPCLDGKVLRDGHGKEIRYPVILTTEEKDIARKICRAFDQTICGFDILRVHNASYVCDVNGWSFVKNSKKYYDDCGVLLRKFLIRSLDSPSSKSIRSISLDLQDDMDEQESQQGVGRGSDESVENEMEEELRCVIAVIRHGDRTPKQKMKMYVTHESFLSFYEKRASSCHSDLKIKSVSDLEELLDISKQLLQLHGDEDKSFLEFLNEKYGEDGPDHVKGLKTFQDVLERWQLCGINRKVQLKPRKWLKGVDGVEKASKILLILKWGGDLTHSGSQQAETLGQRFRHIMYPGSEGGGLLRLHSTYRHDLKIYTSDEGRVQKTAASFAKGFLELEGDIIPILVSLVLKSKDANMMLDHKGTSAQETITKVKARLHHLLHRGDSVSELKTASTSNTVRSVASALDEVGHPIQKMGKMHKLLGDLYVQISEMSDQEQQQSSGSGSTRKELKQPCGRESLGVMAERWGKLYRDFFSTKTNTYDLSKIPDIHDCIRYDAMHNAHLNLRGVPELLCTSDKLAQTLIPQEYGISRDEKVEVAADMCYDLLKKIYADFDIAKGIQTYQLDPKHAKDKYIKSAHRSVRTRLYFTSESHIHTLLNILRFPISDEEFAAVHDGTSDGTKKHVEPVITQEAVKWIGDIPELCYMTHFIFRIFERFQYEESDPRRYRIEILLSPGATGDPVEDFSPDKPLEVELGKFCSPDDLTCQDFQDYMERAMLFDEGMKRRKQRDEEEKI